MAPSTTAELELLTFLSDSNAQVRQVAVEHVASFSAKAHPRRTLLTQSAKLLPALDGKKGRLIGRDGKECDPIEDLKKLCRDQPIAAHDAFSALINLSESAQVATRIADAPFLTFLVTYIADSVSLLADLACMLLSNLTKFESVAGALLQLRVPTKPFYSFMSMEGMDAVIRGIDADPSAADYEERKRAAQEQAHRLVEAAQQQKRQEEQQVAALSCLLDAFEEGATVASNESAVEHMRRKVEQAQRQTETSEGSSQQQQQREVGADGKRKIKRKSNCNFLASVFANVTVLPAGRQWFVEPLFAAQEKTSREAETEREATDYAVARIMVFTEHPDLIRRGGVISALKNILFIKSAHEVLVAPPALPLPASSLRKDADALCEKMLRGAAARRAAAAASLDVLPYLLLPLCAGTELSELDFEDQELLPESCQLLDAGKQREADAALRLMLVECLLLLCTGLYGRVCLRERGAYIVVREAHLRESDEKITEAVVRLVNILKRDESENSLGDAEHDEGESKHSDGKAGRLPGEIDVGAEDERGESGDEDLVIEEL
ncbi:hypothetical protein K437DRAFT_256298 [Tilletiaria anomala UBC 951]|uniref:Protein HGH1 homolog n=1 Tax=Tilletiaria anomala (strain ATCC 24038 / CBS 436.72 / UBC 951) TaxID=1037660 RepID=A0A066W0N9_TILAU|nr:uncharacterized protein K437DRAFT_256298 [Tilletiaria anomala UBC 951]KDN46118.1 hypothetical protein K437DRAFT_256298 [Tilletiaria anomala UBC 951]